MFLLFFVTIIYKLIILIRRLIVRFKRIKDLREGHDLLQKDIANLLGISQQYYSEYEKGNRTIPIQHLITLSKFYGASIDYLVGLADVNLYSKYHKNKLKLFFIYSNNLFLFIINFKIIESIYPFDFLKKLQQIELPFFLLHPSSYFPL